MRVQISAGKTLKEKQCTLKEQAQYVNLWASVLWKGEYRVRGSVPFKRKKRANLQNYVRRIRS